MNKQNTIEKLKSAALDTAFEAVREVCEARGIDFLGVVWMRGGGEDDTVQAITSSIEDNEIGLALRAARRALLGKRDGLGVGGEDRKKWEPTHRLVRDGKSTPVMAMNAWSPGEGDFKVYFTSEQWEHEDIEAFFRVIHGVVCLVMGRDSLGTSYELKELDSSPSHLVREREVPQDG